MLEKALPGRENAKDWLTVKIVECLAQPMDESIAKKLETYNAAYNAVCQWSDDSFTMEDAEAWTSKMQNADGTTGPHWSYTQVKDVAKGRGIEDAMQLWVTMCMLYSDYCIAISATCANTIDFYVDLAEAFLKDKDAQKNKLALYYRYIVK